MARNKRLHPQRTVIPLRRRSADENSRNLTAGEIQAVETPESSVAMEENAVREERLAICRSHGGEKRKSSVQVGGGYGKDRPPEDDCCPICHDDFRIPCRTNCGHWFCASCFLQIWKYMEKSKQCACPVCGFLIFNLVPHPSALIQPEGGVTKILEEISRYNRKNMVGRLGILKKAVAPGLTLGSLTTIGLLMKIMTTRLILAYVLVHERHNIVHEIAAHSFYFGGQDMVLLRLDRVLYEAYNINLFPFGGRFGILIFFGACISVVLVYVVWKRWKSPGRERQMAERNVIG